MRVFRVLFFFVSLGRVGLVFVFVFVRFVVGDLLEVVVFYLVRGEVKWLSNSGRGCVEFIFLVSSVFFRLVCLNSVE